MLKIDLSIQDVDEKTLYALVQRLAELGGTANGVARLVEDESGIVTEKWFVVNNYVTKDLYGRLPDDSQLQQHPEVHLSVRITDSGRGDDAGPERG